MPKPDRRFRNILLCALTILSLCAPLRAPIRAGEPGGGMGDFLGEGIDFKGGMLDWEEDDEGRRVAILRNYAVVMLPQLTISARNMVLNIELQEIYAEGDVLFDDPGGNAFYCDQLTFNYQEWKGLAKNIRVKMDRSDVTLPVRDFLDIVPSTSTTRSASINDVTGGGEGPGATPSSIRRMYVQAQELRAHDQGTFELIDAKISPSSFARPHWYFRSPAALFRRKEKIESYHNTVYAGRVPVLYFPYLIRDLQYDWPWMRITGGHTSDYGFFVQTQWGWKPNVNPNSYIRTDKIIFDLDFFSRRGTGVGVETTYKAGTFDSLGKLKIYGVYEHLTSKNRDLDRAWNDNEDKIYRKYNDRSIYPDKSRYPDWNESLYRKKFRWAIDWEHYQQLNDYWDIRAEAHLYHDRDYLKEYDSKRYWDEKSPENSVSLRRLDKNWVMEFVAQHRLSNKWITDSEYYPEMRVSVPGLQLGDSIFYFKDDFRMGMVNRRFDEDQYRYTRTNDDGLFALDDTGMSTSRLYDRDNYGTFFRAFNEARVEAPIKMMDAFTLKPWVGLRTAYYGDTVGTVHSDQFLLANRPNDLDARDKGYFTPGQRDKKGGSETYYAVPFGVDLSTRTYTMMGAHEQWRLINEPVVSYLENSQPKLNYHRDIYPIDRFDEYYRMRRFGLELHSKLQRRYFEDAPEWDVPERDVLDFNIGFFYYPKREHRDEANNGRKYSEIKTDIIFRPIYRLSLEASLDYDVGDNTINRGIFGVDWRLSNMFRARITHYHYRGYYWRYKNAAPSSQTHFALRTKLWNDSSRYSLEGAVGYEWRKTTDWQTDKDGVRHGFNKYRLTLYRDIDTFELSISYVRDRNADDHGVFFNLAPKSFMGYESPMPAYSRAVETLEEGRYPDSVSYLGGGYLIDAPVADADLKDVQF